MKNTEKIARYFCSSCGNLTEPTSKLRYYYEVCEDPDCLDLRIRERKAYLISLNMSDISRGGGLRFELIAKYGFGDSGMYKSKYFEPFEYWFDNITDMINKLNNSRQDTYAAIKFYLWERGYVKLVAPFPQAAYFFGDGERYRAQHMHNPRDPLRWVIDPCRVKTPNPFFDYSDVLIDLRYVKVLPTGKPLITSPPPKAPTKPNFWFWKIVIGCLWLLYVLCSM
jgi:hypothetical protein